MSQPKPKLRMAPTPAALASQQEAAERLLRLDAWTQEPLNPPTSGFIGDALPMPAVGAPSPPAPVKRPWEVVADSAMHQYSFFMPKSLFLKADYCWKRTNCRSMKDFVSLAIEAYCAEKLKELGEKP